MTDAPKIVIPTEVAVALQTGRGQFVDMLANEVREGRDLPREQVIDLLTLVKNLIEDRADLVIVLRRCQDRLIDNERSSASAANYFRDAVDFVEGRANKPLSNREKRDAEASAPKPD